MVDAEPRSLNSVPLSVTYTSTVLRVQLRKMAGPENRKLDQLSFLPSV